MKIGQNVKLPPDIVAQAVKDLMKESNSKTDTARVSIPLKSSFCENNIIAVRPGKKYFRRGYRHGSQKAYSRAGFGSGFGLVGYTRKRK